MRNLALALALAVAACATPALAQPAAVTTPIGSYTTTNSGQPIMPPAGPVQVTGLIVEMPAGYVLPSHKHPYARYGYVLSGHIRVDNQDAGTSVEYGPGDLIMEARDQWHSGTVLGDQPVKLLVIDQTPPGEGNLVRKAP